MLLPSRFVVLDDRKDHLSSIIETFKLMGSSCTGIHYDSSDDDESYLDPSLYQGVRGFFSDLHLEVLGAGTDEKKHYANITRILEEVITEKNGPFILILWTEYPTECENLKQYIEDSIDSEKPYCKPLCIVPLSKTKFIDKNNGDIINGEANVLKEEIKSCFKSNPQISAIFDWEFEVYQAVNQTLIELVNLIPSPQRSFNTYPDEIDKVLSCITRETVGKTHVSQDPRRALSIAIAPILLDKILNNQDSEENIEQWNKAITKVKSDDSYISDVNSIGRYNKMLHLAVTGHETMKPSDWGAVLHISNFTKTFCNEKFGYSKDQLTKQIFKFQDDQELTPILLRIGAACDYAQNKEGPISYIFGFRVSYKKYLERENDFKDENKPHAKRPGSEWASPLFFVDEEPFYLLLNLQIIVSFTKNEIKSYEVLYRIREQLLNQLILRATTYASRPGITELPAPKVVENN